MGKISKKIVAVVMAMALMLSTVVVAASAATKDNVKQYKNYLALGDSIGSGFGQPEYNKYNKMVVWGEEIPNTYASIVKEAVGAKLTMRQMPGYTTSTLLYELDDNYKMHDWELHELSNFTSGVYDQQFLDDHKQMFRDDIKNADLITLDIGINDTWYSTIALIYYVAEHANNPQLKYGDTRGTLDQEKEKYGSYGTIVRNALAYLDGFATNPTKWAEFWSLWGQNVISYATDITGNYGKIVDKIFEINPNATVVGVGSYNPFEYMHITTDLAGLKYTVKLTEDGKPISLQLGNTTLAVPGKLNLKEGVAGASQILYDLLNAARESYETKYPGKYFYADVDGTETIGKGFTVPMYENSTLDDSGFNPHPTKEGHAYMAEQIIKALPEA